MRFSRVTACRLISLGVEALFQLSRPFLLPEPGGRSEADMLRDVVDLAADPGFSLIRGRYHDWMRDFVAPLRAGGASTLQDVRLDQRSLNLARNQLIALWNDEQAFVKRGKRRKAWTRIEYAVTTVGIAVGVGVAVTAALPTLGTIALVLPFAGWAISKAIQPKESRNLGGASVFIEARDTIKLAKAPTSTGVIHVNRSFDVVGNSVRRSRSSGASCGTRAGSPGASSTRSSRARTAGGTASRAIAAGTSAGSRCAASAAD